MIKTLTALDHFESIQITSTIHKNIREGKNLQSILDTACWYISNRIEINQAWLILDKDNSEIPHYTRWDRNSANAMEQVFDSGRIPICYIEMLDHKEGIILKSPDTYCSECPLHSYFKNNRKLLIPLFHRGIRLGVFCASYSIDPVISIDPEFVNTLAEDLSDAIWSIRIQNRINKKKAASETKIDPDSQVFINKASEKDTAAKIHNEGEPDLQLEDYFDLEQIHLLQKEFCRVTGVSSIIADPEGEPILPPVNFSEYCRIIRKTQKGYGNCIKSDSRIQDSDYLPNTYCCSSGRLWDSSSPIIIGGKHVATWLIGQVRGTEDQKEFIYSYAEEIGADPEILYNAYRNTTRMTSDDLKAAVSLLNTITKQISTIAFQNLKLKKYIAVRTEIISDIKEKEEYLRGILKVAPVGIGVIKDNRILHINNRIHDITGYSSEELINQNREILYADREEYNRVLQEEAAQFSFKGISTIEAVWKHKTGRLINISVCASPLDTADYSKGYVHRIQDITERKEKEKEREILISAYKQSHDSIIVTDSKGNIVFVNPSFEQISGYSEAEVLHLPAACVLKSHLIDSDSYQEIWQTVSSKRLWSGRICNKRKDGSDYIVEASVFPIINPEGAIIHYVCMERDITEQLKIEKENVRLEEQYYQAQKEESIGRLAGGIAHDLNNMLSPILGYSELLLNDSTLDEMKQKRIRQIQEAGERARKLIKQLLTFSRKHDLEFHAVNLNILVSDFMHLLKRTLRENITIRTILDLDLPSVNADPGKIELIIMNLAVNAQDAMPGGGTITIQTEKEHREGFYRIAVKISDTGCGISRDNIDKIFEPYYSTKGDKGTGLGLANVHSIVKQHKGEISVNSTVGKGTVVRISLPVIEENSPAREEEDLHSVESRSTGTILLVEDDPQVRTVTSTILDQYGYNVIPAESAEEALEICTEGADSIDLLLTDIVLPGRDGITLHDKLTEKSPHLKTLFMTGYLEDLQNKEILIKESMKIVQKPLSINLLIGSIQELLKR